MIPEDAGKATGRGDREGKGSHKCYLVRPTLGHRTSRRLESNPEHRRHGHFTQKAQDRVLTHSSLSSWAQHQAQSRSKTERLQRAPCITSASCSHVRGLITQTQKSERAGFESRSNHLPADCVLGFTLVSLSFVIYQMGLRILTASQS